MASSQTRPNRAYHAQPDDPYDHPPRDQDDDHDNRQKQPHVADASQRVLDMGHVWPQTVTDRVADPDRVRHEEHGPEEVPQKECAEGKTDCAGQRTSQKAEPTDESRNADRERTMPADERLRHRQACWLYQPSGVTLDDRPSVAAPEPVAKVVSGDER